MIEFQIKPKEFSIHQERISYLNLGVISVVHGHAILRCKVKIDTTDSIDFEGICHHSDVSFCHHLDEEHRLQRDATPKLSSCLIKQGPYKNNVDQFTFLNSVGLLISPQSASTGWLLAGGFSTSSVIVDPQGLNVGELPIQPRLLAALVYFYCTGFLKM